jgi:hypothetical protein
VLALPAGKSMIEKIEQQDAAETSAIADELSDEALDRPTGTLAEFSCFCGNP